MRTATVSVAALAFGVLTLALPNQPQSLDRYSDAEIRTKLEEAAQRIPASYITDDMLRGLTADKRMDDSVENGNVQISKRFFDSEPAPPPAPHGWGPPPPSGHQGSGMNLVGPFAFQLGAYYNPYLPQPMQPGAYVPAAYGSAAPQPYTVQQPPSYSSSSSSYTTPAPSYSASSYSTSAPSHGNSYSSTPDNQAILGYIASASFPQGYGSSGGY